jgi:hypothetical protein
VRRSPEAPQGQTLQGAARRGAALVGRQSTVTKVTVGEVTLEVGVGAVTVGELRRLR